MSLWDQLKRLTKKQRQEALDDIANQRQVRWVRPPKDNAKLEGQDADGLEIDLNESGV